MYIPPWHWKIIAIDVYRQFDGCIREYWRECDVASIARIYYCEDMNLFYPSIDWCGDGPGYAEMEFPIFPWLDTVLYKNFGCHETLGRVLVYIFSLLALIISVMRCQLSRLRLPGLVLVMPSLHFFQRPPRPRRKDRVHPGNDDIDHSFLGFSWRNHFHRIKNHKNSCSTLP